MSAGARLVYLVLSSTVTAVCEGLPFASVLVTLMVLPETEATVPATSGFFPDGVDGLGVGDGLDGAVVVESGADCLPAGHLPSTAWLTRTVAAVTGFPP